MKNVTFKTISNPANSPKKIMQRVVTGLKKLRTALDDDTVQESYSPKQKKYIPRKD